jgi:hypothetical protein
VTIRTGGTYTGIVGVVYGLLIFFIYVVFHFMTRDTKGFCIGHIQCRIESSPKDNPRDKHAEEYKHGIPGTIATICLEIFF